jgi:hypothetical protein
MVPRPLYNGRTITRNALARTQHVIDAQPSTVTVTRRKESNSIRGVTFPWPTVAEFQCRIDPIKPRMTGKAEDETTPGFSSFSNYLLLCLMGQDKFGSLTDIKHDDQVIIEGVTYRVTNINTHVQWGKIEAVLEVVG